jgi:hypothetical protein
LGFGGWEALEPRSSPAEASLAGIRGKSFQVAREASAKALCQNELVWAEPERLEPSGQGKMG